MKSEEIKKEWLAGGITSYSDKELEEGFSNISDFLGENFIKEKWKGQKGPFVITQIVDLGINLGIVSQIKGFDKLVKRLRNNATYRSAISELSCTIPFSKAGLVTELYPDNPEKPGELEMKLQTKEGEVVYVEVVSPQTQVWNTFLMKLVEPIRKIASNLEDIRLEVYLDKILDKEEQDELFESCKEIIFEGKSQIKRDIKNGRISLSHKDKIEINSMEKKAKEQTSLFVSNMAVNNGHTNVVTIGVPFADLRAKQVLEGEYHQLTTNFPNIIVIDVSGVPKGLENWPQYISRRLQPTINRKISAVCLISSVAGQKIESKLFWISNEHAKYKLENSLLK